MPRTIEIDQPSTRIPAETIQPVKSEIGVDWEPTAELLGSDIFNNIKRFPLPDVLPVWARPS